MSQRQRVDRRRQAEQNVNAVDRLTTLGSRVALHLLGNDPSAIQAGGNGAACFGRVVTQQGDRKVRLGSPCGGS